MSKTNIRTLHVEDDNIQQAILARHLKSIDDYQFEITVAVSEDAALEEFVGSEFDLVILDYHLSQGNGVNCLRFIRQHNPTVAVIAVSGVATDEIAADLIEAGADDYLAKQTLDKSVLARSVRNVLIRAKAYRSRFVTT